MENAKILIVDDDIDLIKSIQVILENQQYNVVTATSRTEGMEKIRVEKPDLVILDVMMETTQEGFDMSREIRKDTGLKDMPILLLTGIGARTGVNFKAAVGMPDLIPVDGYIEKPVAPHILLDEIKKLLSKEA